MPDASEGEKLAAAVRDSLIASLNEAMVSSLKLFSTKAEALTKTILAGHSNLTEAMDRFRDTVRIEIMARLDRLQDEQTKQRAEMETAVELLRDSSRRRCCCG
jgi:hypothetical protein